MTGVRRFWPRALGVWLLLVLTESANGTFRRIVLDPRVGDVRARQIAVVTGVTLIALVLWGMLPPFGAQPARRWWGLGFALMAAMLLFELSVGTLVGITASRLLADFDPRQGGWLAFGMMAILVLTRIVAGARGLVVASSR